LSGWAGRRWAIASGRGLERTQSGRLAEFVIGTIIALFASALETAKKAQRAVRASMFVRRLVMPPKWHIPGGLDTGLALASPSATNER
jgi:hypothetical protein